MGSNTAIVEFMVGNATSNASSAMEMGAFSAGSSDDHEEAREFDVRNLGLQERKELVHRLVGENDEDHSRFLFKLKNRFDRFVLISYTLQRE